LLAGVWLEGVPELLLEDVVELGPGDHDVVIEMGASGVCHTDVSILAGHLHPTPPPAIVGHEAAGVVVDIGRAVRRVRVGDHVLGASVPVCGSCWWCQRGETHLCASTRDTWAGPWRARRHDGTLLRGQNGLGTFAERMTVNETSVVPIESDLPFEELALLGCGVSVGLGAVLNTARPEPGAAVAVIGCGGVGQAMVQGARIAEAEVIIAIDPVPEKLALAVEMGATHTYGPLDANLSEAIAELTDGRGLDYTFEATGLASAQAQALELLRRGGAAVLAGTRLGIELSFETEPFIVAEKRVLSTIYGSIRVDRDFQRFADLARDGHVNLRDMVSARFSLEDAQSALTAVERGEVVRAVLVPDN
jgi:S-(hydroxymethyl)glutathione dehydrogenase/alcohol dehydrogenase